jgi:hypothetical protein
MFELFRSASLLQAACCSARIFRDARGHFSRKLGVSFMLLIHRSLRGLFPSRARVYVILPLMARVLAEVISPVAARLQLRSGALRSTRYAHNGRRVSVGTGTLRAVPNAECVPIFNRGVPKLTGTSVRGVAAPGPTKSLPGRCTRTEGSVVRARRPKDSTTGPCGRRFGADEHRHAVTSRIFVLDRANIDGFYLAPGALKTILAATLTCILITIWGGAKINTREQY